MKPLLRRVARIATPRLLQASAVLTMIALALMVWSMLQPTPLPVMLAMSVGQLLGTIAFGLYGIAIVRDLRRARRDRRGGAQAAEPRAAADGEASP